MHVCLLLIPLSPQSGFHFLFSELRSNWAKLVHQCLNSHTFFFQKYLKYFLSQKELPCVRVGFLFNVTLLQALNYSEKEEEAIPQNYLSDY